MTGDQSPLQCPPPRRRSSFRFAPYGLSVGLVVGVYVVGVVALYLGLGGLDRAANDCTLPFCSAEGVTLILAVVAIPSTLAAMILATLGLVIMHSMGGRLHWAFEGVLAAVGGLVLSGLLSALILLVFS